MESKAVPHIIYKLRTDHKWQFFFLLFEPSEAKNGKINLRGCPSLGRFNLIMIALGREIRQMEDS
jgi:hypothetical protein